MDIVRKRPFAVATIILLLALGFFLPILYKLDFTAKEKIAYGATFSIPRAESLGLNWRETLIAALDDLGIRNFRIVAYWNQIEPSDDQFDFTALDWQVGQIAKRGGKITLALGQRLPGWPECHTPEWAKKLARGEQQQKIMQMIPVVVSRYEDNPAVVRWQAEDEPMLPSADACHHPDERFFAKEVELVRRMDSSRPVMTTGGDEFGLWAQTGKQVDVLGVSLYRVEWKTSAIYPLPPAFYKLQAESIKKTAQKIILSDLHIDEPNPTNSARLQKLLSYAGAAGFDEIHLNGLEWLYWQKTKQASPEMWEAARSVFTSLATQSP